MRFLLALALLSLSVSLSAQKAIPLEKAILESRGELAPDQMKQLQWLPDNDTYSYTEGDLLEISDFNGRAVRSISLSAINTDGQSFKKWPRVNWLTSRSFFVRKGQDYLHFDIKEAKWTTLVTLPENADNSDFHVGSGNLAFTIDHNLHVISAGRQSQVTDEEEGIVSGQAIARYEFGIGKGTFWSPNGSRLAYYQKDERHVGEYPLTDYSTVPASVYMIKYPMAGSHSEHAAAFVYDIKSGKRVQLDCSKFGSTDEFYITNIGWAPSNDHVMAAIVSRGQDEMQLARFDANNGKLVDILYQEKSESYVEPEHAPFFLPSGKSFLWFSEASGKQNLLHIAYPSGELIGKTAVDFPITEFIGFDKKGRNATVIATGGDATQRHIFRLDLRRHELFQLTRTFGVHGARLSPSGTFILDTWSNTDTPGMVDLINSRGKKLTNLHTAKNPLVGYSYSKPEIFQKDGHDGTDLWCRMIKPSNFDRTKKYPVLVYVYNGPHAQMIDKRWMGKAAMWMYTLAEEGYIIFTVDGHGSTNQGHDFESAIHRQLGDLEVKDQVAVVNWLRRESYVDANRMAIHGWSYGGFMTTSLMLKEPGLFKVGVAGGPVIDWSLYEVMYTERYMDTPEENPEGYRRADLRNYVRELDGKLLMIHGGVDDVVLMQHNLSFQRKCIEEGVQVDFYMYPSHPHNVRGKDRIHLMTKVFDYIKLHL